MREYTELEWRQPFRAKITGQSTVGGVRRYTWIEQSSHAGTAASENADYARAGDADSGWAVELNNADVPTNTIVELKFRCMIAGVPVYEFAYEALAGSTIATITVTDVAGTKSYSSINTLQIDEADGYLISNPSVGTVRFDFTGGGSSVLTVMQYPSGPSIANTTTIQFNADTGLFVTQNGANTALVLLQLSALFPPPYFVILPPGGGGPPGSVRPTIKYESYFRDPARWFFGGEPHNASRVHFSVTNATPNKDRYYAMPYLEARGGLVDGIACWVTQLGTGGTIRLGIYTNFSDDILQPYQRELDAGEINAAIGGGNVPELKTLSIAHRLQPNTLYWLVMVVYYEAVTPIQIKIIDRDYCWNLLGNDDDWADVDAQGGWYADSAYGALPQTFPLPLDYLTTVGAVANHLPAVALRYALDDNGEDKLAGPMAGIAGGMAPFVAPAPADVGLVSATIINPFGPGAALGI